MHYILKRKIIFLFTKVILNKKKMSTQATQVAPIATADQLANLNSSSIVGVTTLKNQLNALQTSFTSIQTQLSTSEPTSLVNTITDLQTRVTEIETILVAVLNN